MKIVNRAGPGSVALETTLLVHGVPRGEGRGLAERLGRAVREGGAREAIVGVVRGRAIVGLTDAELGELLSSDDVAKVNTANLGVVAHRGGHGATTVSATMELAARAGVRVFATGGIGGVHRGYGERLDVSADLAALARWAVCVVCSGVKSILDVRATREALEALGVPVVGFGTACLPRFYVRESGVGVDARFDDAAELAGFVGEELAGRGRGVLVVQACPADEALEEREWERVLGEAMAGEGKEAGGDGREVTPRVLAQLHRVSGGATLRANVALAESNGVLAGRLAARLAGGSA